MFTIWGGKFELLSAADSWWVLLVVKAKVEVVTAAGGLARWRMPGLPCYWMVVVVTEVNVSVTEVNVSVTEVNVSVTEVNVSVTEVNVSVTVAITAANTTRGTSRRMNPIF